MFKNYLKIALRNLSRHKIFSAINILGLAIGIAGCLLILQYVRFELSYDSFNNAENIYRVRLDQFANNTLVFKSSENYPGVGPALKKELPEVLEYARLYNLGSKNNVVITYNDAPGEPIMFKHRRFLYADSSFLPMFDYPMVMGDAKTALKDPLTMVISESYAKKYFGDENPIGKFLHLKDDDYNDELCKVTGVVIDPPPNTHLKFDVLISYKTLYTRGDWAPGRYGTTWQRKDMYTYITVKPGTDQTALEAKFPAIVDKYNPGLAEQNRRDELSLQPLKEIHLYSHLTDEAEINGNGDAVYFLLIIAVFIVIIAWVNYINLSTARAMERAKEVGLRKVVGAFRSQLIRQFLAESLLVNFFAVLLAVALVILSLNYFNQLAGLSFSWPLWSEPWFWGALVGLFVCGTLLAGGYPAFVLSSFQPITVLRGKFSRSSQGNFLRKILVVLQFAASAALLVGTFVVHDQLSFMNSQDLGFSMEQMMVVERPGIASRDREQRGKDVEAFKNMLKENHNISEVTAANTLPGKKMRFKTGVRKFTATPEEEVQFTFSGIDYDFIDTFDMEVIAGRKFDKSYPSDEDTAAVITASAAKMLGFANPEDAIGKTLAISRFRWNPIIIGVLKDYHQESLKLETNPTLFYMSFSSPEYFYMKVNTAGLQGAIEHVSASWTEVFPGNPFHFFFLDDYFNKQYETDQKFGQLFSIFAGLAIFIASLGLFGLSAFTTRQRTKEIGVRKVLGARISTIILLLSKDVFKLVVIANLIAWPLMYYIMNRWLEDYAYRVDINWTLFLIAGAAVLLMALATISYETFRAATRNPVDSLKYE